MSTRRALLGLAALALVLSAACGSAAAHKTAYSPDGKVKIVWGFLDEPAVTYRTTGIDLSLRDNATGAPLEGAEKTLDATLVLGGETYAMDISPQSDRKGWYTDAVTLTRPGLYSLRLVGSVNGSTFDVTIPAQHEVSDVSETYFPQAAGPGELAAQVKALQDEVAALKAQKQTQSATPTPLTDQGGSKGVPAPGALAALAVLAVAALLVARRRA